MELSEAGGDGMSDPEAPRDPRSPVCHAAKAEDAYMGYLGRQELGAFLNTLLKAERAGARVAAGLVAASPDAELKDLSRVIQADEARWCHMLMGALKALGIEDIEARLAFVNQGQAWVVRKLAEILPKMRDDALYASLNEMLAAHRCNIVLAEEALTRRSSAAGPLSPMF